MEKKRMTVQYLPHELIIQILLRLPVKFLIRFKCVCKSWFSLISADSHFANSQFQITAATRTHRILLMSTPRPRESRSIDFEAPLLYDDSACVSLYPNFTPLESYYRIKIRGSCRGFLLLHCYNIQTLPMFWIYEIYIWNPSTGFHKKIPSSPFSSGSDIQYYTYFYGFGYDQSTNDYLLVRMSSDSNNNDLPLLHLDFFSLRANTWKEIECTQFSYTRPTGNEQPTAGFLFNGAINWFAYRHDLGENVIVAFDLMEKKLFNMHLPVDFDRDELGGFGLWVVGESLSIWVEYYLRERNDDNYNRRLEVWVMKEYKADSPWTKILVHSFNAISHRSFFPICSTKSGDIIGTQGFLFPTLAKCDDKGQLLEYHSYFEDNDGYQVALYIESLLSLPDNEKVQEDDSSKKNEELNSRSLKFSVGGLTIVIGLCAKVFLASILQTLHKQQNDMAGIL